MRKINYRKFILNKLNGFRFYTILEIVFRIISSILTIFIPLKYANLIDNLLNFNKQAVYKQLLLLVILHIISLIINYIIMVVENKVNININSKMRQFVVKSILNIPPYKMSDYNQGELYSILLNDSTKISYVLHSYINICFSIVNFLLIAAVTLTINWILTSLIIITCPIILLVNYIFKKHIKKQSKLMIEEYDNLNYTAKNVIYNLNNIRSQKSRNIILKNFNIYDNSYRVKSTSLQNAINNYSLANKSVSLLNFIILTSIGMFLVLNKTIDFASFVAFGTYSKTLASLINYFINFNTIIQPSYVSLDRIAELENKNITITKIEESKLNFPKEPLYIDIKNLTYSYDGNRSIITNFSMNLKQGLIYGINGKNATGKTTIAKLLAKKIQPNNNQIFINGIDINSISYYSLSKTVSHMESDSILYDLTLKENMTMESENIVKEDRIFFLCNILNFTKDVENLPLGLDTLINSTNDFSKGQRQKIQIVRSFVSDSKIFIFDEALSNLDKASKLNLLNFLKDVKKQNIIIIISHDVNDFIFCDQIYNLDQINDFQ